MTKYVLAGCFGSSDTEAYALAGVNDEQLKFLDFLVGKKSLRFGIGSAISQLAKLNIYPSEVGLDLLMVAIMVQAVDTRLNRIQTSQDAWTREIKIIAPVSDTELWSKGKDVLERMLRFLTGDLWQVEFRARPNKFKNLIKRKLLSPYDCDGVSLFSGGLDSLVGAIDSLEAGSVPLFVSHAGEGAVSSPQSAVFERLLKEYPAKKIHRLLFPSARFHI